MELKKSKSGIWHAHFRDSHGDRRSISTKKKDKAEAKKVVESAKIEELEQVAGVTRLTGDVVSRIATGKRVTVKDAAAQWGAWLRESQDEHTAYAKIVRVNAWVQEMGLASRYIHDVNREDVSAYINKPSNKKHGSLTMDLGVISGFLEYCYIAGMRLGNPAKLVRVNMNNLTHEQKEKRTVEVFTPDEVKKILANTEGFWKAATALSYYCGLRIGDVCQLEWRSLDKPGRLIVWTDKADVRLDVALPGVVLAILSEMPVVHKRYLFPHEREVNLSPTRRAVLSVNFKNLLIRLGIEGKTFHGLRHTYAMKLKGQGYSPEQIAEGMAHRDLKSQKTYTNH